MANIQKRGENSYFFTVYTGKGPDGKYKRRTKTITVTEKMSPKKLQEYLEFEYAKFKQEVLAGEYIAPNRMTFKDFVQEWHDKYAVKQLSNTTLNVYMMHLNNRVIPQIGHLHLEDIKTMMLVDLFENISSRMDGNEGELSPATIHYIYRSLNNVFQRAVEWKLIKENPMKGVSKPKLETRTVEVYTQEEVNELLELLEGEPDHWRVMVKLALTTGLRRGELLALEWKHIDLENGTLRVEQSLTYTKTGGYEIKEPKTKSSKRIIELPTSLIPELKAYKAKCNQERLACADNLWEDGKYFFVFSSWQPGHPGGKPLHPTSVKTWWHRFLKRHGLRHINFHGLRHTSATLLLNQGLHAKVIQARLGHSKITTTLDIYAHVLREADKGAAAVFDGILQKNKA